MTERSENDDETALFSLVYCSRAVQSLRTADIEAIVAAARLKNSRENITGWLVYGSGVFFQWLEGRREAVKNLMASITADPRHSTIVILSESEDVGERLFGDWDMELVSADDIRAVLLDAISESHDARNIKSLRALLNEVDSKKLVSGLNKMIDL